MDLTTLTYTYSYPVAILEVSTVSASGLQRSPTTGPPTNPFCYVQCQGQASKSVRASSSADPVWNSSHVFYINNFVKSHV